MRPPAHFNEAHFERYFPSAKWQRRAAGPTVLHTLPMHDRATSDHDEIKAYFAVVSAR